MCEMRELVQSRRVLHERRIVSRIRIGLRCACSQHFCIVLQKSNFSCRHSATEFDSMESKQFASFQKAVVRDEILLRLRNSDSKDVSSWTDLVRYDVIKCVTLSPGDTSEWKQIAQIADKAIHSYRDLFKQFPSHFVSIVLDHARCLL